MNLLKINMEIKETSVGGIIYKIMGDRLYFLLLKQSSNGLWEFPKGNIEKNESEIECAKREIFEEAGINPSLLKNFRREIEYINEKKSSSWLKKEIFYIFKSHAKEIKLSHEHSEHGWFSLNKSLHLIEFTNVRHIMAEASNYILKSENLIKKKFDNALNIFEKDFIKKSVICYFVSGSYYNNNLKPDSDIDIFVVTEPSIKREKGVYMVGDVKISYFMNPINKTYDLLISEKWQLKRPTSEMIFFSHSFLDKKMAKKLKNLAKISLKSNLKKMLDSEAKYYGWKLYDKFSSYCREMKSDKIKASFLEIDLFDFSINLFLLYNREYRPHTKYLMEKIMQVDKKFGKMLFNYLADEGNSFEIIDGIVQYLLKTIKFQKKNYKSFSKI